MDVARIKIVSRHGYSKPSNCDEHKNIQPECFDKHLPYNPQIYPQVHLEANNSHCLGCVHVRHECLGSRASRACQNHINRKLQKTLGKPPQNIPKVDNLKWSPKPHSTYSLRKPCQTRNPPKPSTTTCSSPMHALWRASTCAGRAGSVTTHVFFELVQKAEGKEGCSS